MNDYEIRVRALEAQGLTRSDAQGCVDAEDMQAERIGLPLEYIHEYDAAAEWCVRNQQMGKAGDRLPDLLSDVVYTEINTHLEAFQERIRDIAYSTAMEYALTQRRIKPCA